jgi:predicted peptidase
MLTTTIIAAATFLAAAPTKVDDYFETCDHRYGERQERSVRYHLFVPGEVRPNKRYPMLVWLYQAGNVTPGFVAFVFRDIERIKECQFFLVAIQYPSSDPGWFQTVGARNYRDADAALVAEIVHKLVREHPADEDRVCASGASAGGGRCWEVAVRQPELFSAVVPLASGSNDMAMAANLVNTPIWAFHNQGDVGSPVKNVQVMVEAVKAVGGYVHLTVFPQPGHDAWTAPFRDHDILSWMFAQRRGARICWVPPGTVPWKWRHILAEPCIFFGIVGLGWYLERTRRRRGKRR